MASAFFLSLRVWYQSPITGSFKICCSPPRTSMVWTRCECTPRLHYLWPTRPPRTLAIFYASSKLRSARPFKLSSYRRSAHSEFNASGQQPKRLGQPPMPMLPNDLISSRVLPKGPSKRASTSIPTSFTPLETTLPRFALVEPWTTLILKRCALTLVYICITSLNVTIVGNGASFFEEVLRTNKQNQSRTADCSSGATRSQFAQIG